MTDSLREPLREQVARRLADVYGGGGAMRMRAVDQDGLDAMADEVIRLMEWARQRRAKPLWKYPAVRTDNEIIGWVPLTLPPEGWKP